MSTQSKYLAGLAALQDKINDLEFRILDLTEGEA